MIKLEPGTVDQFAIDNGMPVTAYQSSSPNEIVVIDGRKARKAGFFQSEPMIEFLEPLPEAGVQQ